MNDTICYEEVQRFTQDFATMLERNETVPNALQQLAYQEGNTYFKCIIEEVHEYVCYGETLTDSLMRHPSVFDCDYVDAVRVGEENGTLPASLLDLSRC